jgi:hypothetical protein
MGKYIRHLLAAIIGVLVGAVVAVLGKYLGADFTPEQIEGFTDALTNALLPGVTLWLYAWSEKYLKRFAWLDPEGFTDRLRLKQQSQGIDTAGRRL